MVKREGKKWLAGMVSMLLLLAVAEGCARKGVISDRVMETLEQPPAAEERVAAVPGAEYPAPEEPVLPEPGMIGDSEAAETGSAAGFAASIGDIFFDFDRDLIRSDSRKALEKNARWLRENRGARIVIEGHADERGTTEYNLALGERRALATKRYLVSLGVEPGRIRTISYGEERPFCTESDESCWQQNRRGHFVLAD